MKLLRKHFHDYDFDRQLPQLARKPIGKANRNVPIIRAPSGWVFFWIGDRRHIPIIDRQAAWAKHD